MAVYLVRGPSRFRIGTVGGSSSGTFTVPAVGSAATEPIQIMADPIGSRATYTTEPVIVGRGQRLELRLMNPLSMSTFAVWDR